MSVYPVDEVAHVAQLVEHSHGKGEVTGSNPVAGSMLSSRWPRGVQKSK